MEYLNHSELKRLAAHLEAPSVSLFMPAHRRGPETQQDPIRFGNLIRTVEAELAASGMRTPDVQAFLAPARTMLADEYFWRHQQDGLAVFFSASEYHAYRLPFTVRERAVFADRYFLSPLLPLFTNNGHFYILALSLNQVRLFEATRFTVGEIDLPGGAPASMADVEGEIDSERGVAARTVGPAGSGASAYYHSGGGGSDERTRIARYLNELDKALLPLLRDGDAPLVIAADVSLLPIYREVTNYAHVVEDGPRGNPEALRPDELHAHAWPFVEERFRASLESALGAYAAQAGTGRTGAGLDEVVPAALFGRIDTLLVPVGLEIWGTVAPETGRVTRTDAGASEAVELEGFAASQTILNGGTVYAVDAEAMPEGAEIAAIYRF